MVIDKKMILFFVFMDANSGCICGISSLSDPQSRIVGGTNASIEEVPWQVQLAIDIDW